MNSYQLILLLISRCHPRILNTFTKQAQKLTLASRAVYCNRLAPLEEKLSEVFGYDKALLMNSGV